MLEKDTNELLEMLKQTKSEDLRHYYAVHEEYLANEDRAFYYYFREILKKKGISLKNLYSFAGCSESYGGKIIRMEKNTNNRDFILRFCIAGHFTLLETNRALKLYQMGELYPKIPRDACIIKAILDRRYDLADVDDLLIQNGFPQLSVEE